MEHLFQKSLSDLGHTLTTYEEADLVFCLQNMDCYRDKKERGKKYILIQVEDWMTKPNSPTPGEHSSFTHIADRVWGFDITNPHEEYIYLGYHPFLDISNEKYIIWPTRNIAFLGSKAGRRGLLNKSSKNGFSSVAQWDYFKAIRILRSYKINIHIHSFGETNFTPWDRMVKFLCNKIFFMVEDCYLPDDLCMVPKFTYDQYDSEISKYLNNKPLRQEIANETYKVWKRKFDMRSLLEDKLSHL